jgi:hypothetical protein
MHVDQLTATFARDALGEAFSGHKGYGYYTNNVSKESITAAYNAASLTLAEKPSRERRHPPASTASCHPRARTDNGEYKCRCVQRRVRRDAAVITITPLVRLPRRRPTRSSMSRPKLRGVPFLPG